MVTSLAYLVTILKNEFSNYCNGRLEEIGLTQGLLFFILYIGRKQTCSPKQLTEALRMDAGYATRSLAKLEKEGFIIQAINPKDRRARILELTEQGKEAFAFSHELFYEWDAQIMKELDPQQKEALLDSMQQLLDRKNNEGCVRTHVERGVMR